MGILEQDGCLLNMSSRLAGALMTLVGASLTHFSEKSLDYVVPVIDKTPLASVDPTLLIISSVAITMLGIGLMLKPPK